MNIADFLSSTIGKKFIVALTGLFMLFFLVAHLVANLGVYGGPDAINSYAAMLRDYPIFLWSFRILLIVSVVTHVTLTISLTRKNRAARPASYAVKSTRQATLASRTMMISGLTVLVFIAYHLSHYTLGITNPEFMDLVDDKGRHHVYNMMVMGFSHPLVVGFYVLAQALLGFHISHGVSSTARTLGLSDRNIFSAVKRGGVLFAIVYATLFISIPVSVWFGILTLAS